ncbi:hypothetical protein A3N50_13990 [Klebsiella aerogenes]|nr:hypothetical protein A3N50_13990 [Klebsiella aerogenes]
MFASASQAAKAAGSAHSRDEAEQIETQLGYKDAFLDTAEHFYLFVIQGPKSLAAELRLDNLPPGHRQNGPRHGS